MVPWKATVLRHSPILSGLLLFGLSALLAVAEVLQIEGTLHTEDVAEHNNAKFGEAHYRFRMFSEPPRYLIITQNELRKAAEPTETITGSDGVDSYQVHYYDTKGLEAVRTLTKARGFATVNPSTFPTNQSTAARVLWWFAGVSQKDYNPAVKAVPFNYTLGTPLEAFVVDTQWETNAPFLPKTVDFYHPAFEYPIINSRRGSMAPLPKPYESGFQAGSFRTYAWTNVAALSLPTRFVMQQFVRRSNFANTSNDLHILVRCEGTITNISISAPESGFLPAIEGDIRIVDNRFEDQNKSLLYQLSNTNWLTRDDPKLLQFVALARPNTIAGSEIPGVPGQKRTLLIFMTSLSIIAIALVALLGRMKANKHVNTQ